MAGLKVIKERINAYVEMWKRRGYPQDIPDDVPSVLMKENLAPSYKAICLAILRNDNNLESLGFSHTASEWYSALKHVELLKRERAAQMSLFHKNFYF